MNKILQLFNNQIDYIIVDDFLSAQQIAAFLQALKKQSDWVESHIDDVSKRLFNDIPRSPQLFASQYVEITRGMSEAEYIKECERYQIIWNTLTTECGFDPFQLLQHWLKQQDINAEPVYFPLSLRDLAKGTLIHADFGPYDGSTWAINQVQHQIAWNIYLTDPISGGETIIYNHLWQETDTLDDPNLYGNSTTTYPIKKTFDVQPGRLVLFNSRNFHSVNPSQQSRTAIGGLLGLIGNNVIAWT